MIRIFTARRDIEETKSTIVTGPMLGASHAHTATALTAHLFERREANGEEEEGGEDDEGDEGRERP